MPRLPLSLVLALMCAGQIAPRGATSWHVAPAGAPAGDGSRTRPWDLATAFAGAAGRIRAGDTVWLEGGTYRGAFRTELRGAPGRHIVFRQQRGARATIDGTLRAGGEHLTFWGFEITQSIPATYGLEARTNSGRFVNLVIHGAGRMGVSFWTPGEDAELYGCIVYGNGTRENLDHGVYVHNERGTKRLTDNVVFENLAYGIHVYAARTNPPQRNVHITGNAVFDNGTTARRYRAKGNILVGGEVPMSGMVVADNFLYFAGPDGVNLRLGYAAVGNDDVAASGNVIWGGAVGIQTGTWARAQVGQNLVLLPGALAPPAPKVFVRPNRYEPGRAHVIVYNWSREGEVRVDLSRVLARGQRFEMRRVQDLWGPPVLRGAYSGDSVSVPLKVDAAPAAFAVLLVTVSDSAAPTDKSR